MDLAGLLKVMTKAIWKHSCLDHIYTRVQNKKDFESIVIHI